MDRRNFLRTMGATAAAAAVAETGMHASPFLKDKAKSPKKESVLLVRFLGTGAAD